MMAQPCVLRALDLPLSWFQGPVGFPGDPGPPGEPGPAVGAQGAEPPVPYHVDLPPLFLSDGFFFMNSP